MARNSAVRLAAYEYAINKENAAAARDIAILQNDTAVRVAQLQTDAQFQTAVVQTLGNAFNTGMQSYFQTRLAERQMQREAQSEANKMSLLLRQDQRETLQSELNIKRGNLELTALQKQADEADKQLMAEKAVPGYRGILAQATASSMSNRSGDALNEQVIDIYRRLAEAGLNPTAAMEDDIEKSYVALQQNKIRVNRLSPNNFGQGVKAMATTQTTVGAAVRTFNSELMDLASSAEKLGDLSPIDPATASPRAETGAVTQHAANLLANSVNYLGGAAAYVPALEVLASPKASAAARKDAALSIRNNMATDTARYQDSFDMDVDNLSGDETGLGRKLVEANAKWASDKDSVVAGVPDVSTGTLDDARRYRMLEALPVADAQRWKSVLPEDTLRKWTEADKTLKAHRRDLATAAATAVSASVSGATGESNSPMWVRAVSAQAASGAIPAGGVSVDAVVSASAVLKAQPYNADEATLIKLESAMEGVGGFTPGSPVTRANVLQLSDLVLSGQASPEQKDALVAVINAEVNSGGAARLLPHEAELWGEYTKKDFAAGQETTKIDAVRKELATKQAEISQDIVLAQASTPEREWEHARMQLAIPEVMAESPVAGGMLAVEDKARRKPVTILSTGDISRRDAGVSGAATGIIPTLRKKVSAEAKSLFGVFGGKRLTAGYDIAGAATEDAMNVPLLRSLDQKIKASGSKDLTEYLESDASVKGPNGINGPELDALAKSYAYAVIGGKSPEITTIVSQTADAGRLGQGKIRTAARDMATDVVKLGTGLIGMYPGETMARWSGTGIPADAFDDSDTASQVVKNAGATLAEANALIMSTDANQRAKADFVTKWNKIARRYDSQVKAAMASSTAPDRETVNAAILSYSGVGDLKAIDRFRGRATVRAGTASGQDLLDENRLGILPAATGGTMAVPTGTTGSIGLPATGAPR